jgi:hypothetical protein
MKKAESLGVEVINEEKLYEIIGHEAQPAITEGKLF